MPSPFPRDIADPAEGLIWYFSQPDAVSRLISRWHSTLMVPPRSFATNFTGRNPFMQLCAHLCEFFDRLFAGRAYAFTMARAGALQLYDSPAGLSIPADMIPSRLAALLNKPSAPQQLAPLVELLATHGESEDTFLFSRGRLLGGFYVAYLAACRKARRVQFGLAVLTAAVDITLGARQTLLKKNSAGYNARAGDEFTDSVTLPADPLFAPLAELRAELFRQAFACAVPPPCPSAEAPALTMDSSSKRAEAPA